MICQSIKIKNLLSYPYDFFQKNKIKIEIHSDASSLSSIEDSEWEIIKNKIPILSVIFHAPYENLCFSSEDDFIREYSIRQILNAISVAEILNISKIIFHTGFNPFIPIHKRKEAYAIFQESISYIYENIGYKKITLLVENTYEKDFYYFEKAFTDFPNLKMVLDIGHCACFSSFKIEEWYHAFKGRIEHYHLHDNDLQEDLHLSLGKGKIDLKSVFSLISQDNKTITLETPFEELESNYYFLKSFLGEKIG